MASSRTPVNNSDQPLRLAELIRLTPNFASYDADWRSITLEFFDIPPGQTPEYCLDHYVVSITLGPNEGGYIRRITENDCEKATFSCRTASICPIHRPHFLELNTSARILSLNLKPELLHSQATELLSCDRVELLPRLNIHDDLIYQFGLALQTELQTSGSTNRLYAETLTSGLAVHLLRNYSTIRGRTITCKGGLSQHTLKLVTDYIDDNLEQEIGLKELATISQLSQYHFCRMFKRSNGLSPHKYVTRERVERAKRLLKQGLMTLAEIAVACGFSHQSHLHPHFKRLTGVTPKIWLNS
ncbi:MAG: helix-turn-helix domain-containing protein [Nodosilinea sp.]